MVSLDTRVCPNTAEVAAKIMDGEAILINLSDGMYYSMDLVGGLVWELIEARHSLREIVETVVLNYGADAEQAEGDVQRLVQELLGARLILPCGDGPNPGRDRLAPPVQRLAYEPPRLNSYTDMADLLALDPPHPWLSDTLSRYPRDAQSS